MDRTALKTAAKQQIKGKMGIVFLMNLAVLGIIMLVSFVPVVGGLANNIFFSPVFSISLTMVYLNISVGKEVKFEDIFEGFYHFWSAFKLTFFTSLFISLWSLLLIVPGIIKSFSYAMAYYIWAENKEMGALEAITKSRQMMEGHKMDLFVLSLSFLGWIFLTALTFGIAGIYTLPYMEVTFVNFYHSIKGEAQTEILLN